MYNIFIYKYIYIYIYMYIVYIYIVYIYIYIYFQLQKGQNQQKVALRLIKYRSEWKKYCRGIKNTFRDKFIWLVHIKSTNTFN